MTIDLTGRLLEAYGRAGEWSKQRLVKLANDLVACLPGLKVDWEPDAGEDWASVLRGDHVVGILHARIPFAMLVDGQDQEALAALAQRDGVVVVRGPDYLESEVFSIDPAALPSLRPAFTWLSENPPTNLSMHDIYFASV